MLHAVSPFVLLSRGLGNFMGFTVFGEALGQTILQHLKNFPKGKPVRIDIPESFRGHIEYTKRDHARNASSRSVHRHFQTTDTSDV